MGYDFHISRAAEWSESESKPISLSEWKEYVASDPEFRFDTAEATTPKGETIRYVNEGLARWTPRDGLEEGRMGWFDYRRGRIVVKNADQKTIEKMKQIAAFFEARVFGDEGEEY